MEWTMAQRRVVTKKLAQEYRGADRQGKGRVLDTLVKLTGYNRCYAAWLLRHWGRKYWVKIDGKLVRLVVGAVRPRRAVTRPRRYDEPVAKVLKRLWESFDYMCGQRLAAMMKELLPVLVGGGELYCNPRTYQKLLALSGASIDRLLKPVKDARKLRGQTHTKPTSLLKAQIPIRTWAELPVNEPGHYQADLVGHDGGNARGEYAYSLDCTELFSGWSEPRALSNRAHRGVCSAVEDVHQLAPVPMKSLHTDTGGEFINLRLLDWCQRQHLEFCRGRPCRRNDTCHVEQKNFNLIRQAVGYARFDSPQEVSLLGQLYAQLRLLVNHFYPSMKLVEKRRSGSHVYKRYDTPQTPYRRLLDCAQLEEGIKERLREEHRHLRPLQLKRRIVELQEQLYRLARAKYSPANGLEPQAETTNDEEVPIQADGHV
jgi:hypothetical protein